MCKLAFKSARSAEQKGETRGKKNAGVKIKRTKQKAGVKITYFCVLICVPVSQLAEESVSITLL